MDALIRLHQARWQSKGEPGSFALPGVEEFLKEVMRASFQEARLQLGTLTKSGEIIAARVAFLDNNKSYGFQGGFDPAYNQYSLGNVSMALCIKDCFEDESIREYVSWRKRRVQK
jgi:CelD/BcsL family acetyltransferase involved in cellulose biosynthesis